MDSNRIYIYNFFSRKHSVREIRPYRACEYEQYIIIFSVSPVPGGFTTNDLNTHTVYISCVRASYNERREIDTMLHIHVGSIRCTFGMKQLCDTHATMGRAINE